MGSDIEALLRDELWKLDLYGIRDERCEAPEEYDDLLDELVIALRASRTKQMLIDWVDALSGRFSLPDDPVLKADLHAFTEHVWSHWRKHVDGLTDPPT